MTAPDADFRAAHRRHWNDAGFLFDNCRWPNADQLYGFSAECGLKTIMLKEGMKVDEKGRPKDEEYRKHIHKLWPIFRGFIANLRGREYLRGFPSDDPFANWSQDERYADGEYIDREHVEPHREAAQKVNYLVQLCEENKP